MRPATGLGFARVGTGFADSLFDEVAFAPVYCPIAHTGACGIAALVLPNSTSRSILVTTLNGELVVFAQTNGVVDPNPVFRRVVEGSIGAYNSIVLANLDPVDAKPELYLGGSSGIRRFDVQ